ncbi:MAG: hypothetical protein RBQ97_08075 [Acholeplasma sp.]|nr:hypothetical protein [Acholeplasma sp.]
MNKLIKDVVELDKELRDKISGLEKQKISLINKIREEKSKLISNNEKQIVLELEKQEKESNTYFLNEVEKMKKDHEKRLERLTKKYQDNKDLWLDKIFKIVTE